MSMIFALVNQEGLIVRTGTLIAEKEDHLVIGCDNSISDESHYYDHFKEVFEEKCYLDVGYSVDDLTVSFMNLPAGIKAVCMGSSITSDESGVQIEFEKPGVYIIEFMNNKEFRDESLEVSVG